MGRSCSGRLATELGHCASCEPSGCRPGTCLHGIQLPVLVVRVAGTRPGSPDGIDLRGVRDNAVTGYRVIEELCGRRQALRDATIRPRDLTSR